MTEKGGTADPSLEALNHLPDVKNLVSDILVFRDKMARDVTSDKSPEGTFFCEPNLLLCPNTIQGFL